MPLTIDLSVDELARTRFAISPLSETISALHQLAFWQRQVHRRWLWWARAELAARPLALPLSWPLLVHDRPGWPQFLLPAPARTEPTIGQQLAALQQTAPAHVRASLERTFGPDLPPAAAELAADPKAGLRAIAAELLAAHDRLIGPHWGRIRALLGADIAYRARQLAAGGIARLLDDLHPDLRWQDGQIRLADVARHNRASRAAAPGGLVLLPVVLGPAYVLVKLNTTTQTTVRYPARGLGSLWGAGLAAGLSDRSAAGPAVRLLGRPRTRLLAELRSPASPSELARALAVTPSAVSQHLAVLREAGLVSREQAGRRALYQLTPPGRQLLDRSQPW